MAKLNAKKTEAKVEVVAPQTETQIDSTPEEVTPVETAEVSEGAESEDITETAEESAEEVESEEGVEETTVEDIMSNEVEVAEEPQQTQPVVEVVKPPVEAPKVQVDMHVDYSSGRIPKKEPQQNAKIRLRVDHKCSIGHENYNFVAGKVYTVPRNVKKVLNRAGLLAPL